jgi:IS30 family transposase
MAYARASHSSAAYASGYKNPLRSSMDESFCFVSFLLIEINCILKINPYFCQPYHSWEKGTVENTNGLIRRFFPKDANFDNISNAQIAVIESWLNNRPRKCLKYYTPLEVFNSSVALAT